MKGGRKKKTMQPKNSRSRSCGCRKRGMGVETRNVRRVLRRKKGRGTKKRKIRKGQGGGKIMLVTLYAVLD